MKTVRIGSTYGIWKALGETNRKTHYRCICKECERVSDVCKYKILKKEQKACRRCSEFNEGDVAGDWTVVSEDKTTKRVSYKCVCKCGKIKTMLKTHLRSSSFLCCWDCCKNEKKRRVTAGDKFNGWTVISEVEKTSSSRQFLCKCECGNIKKVNGKNLFSGATRWCSECGKKGLELDVKPDDIFGKWLVLKESRRDRRGKIFLCRCECGTISEVNAGNLFHKGSLSCGHCWMANELGKTYNEWTIVEILEDKNKGGYNHVLAKCSCGALIKTILSRVKGRVENGCDNCIIHWLPNEIYGRWLVKSFAYKDDEGKKYFNIECECGTKAIRPVGNINKVGSMSCGCKAKEIAYYLGKFRTGEISNGWDDSITDEERQIKRNYPEYREWVEAVLTKDNGTCVLCGSTEKPQCHHLDAYSTYKSQRCEISNGIVLCKEHHDMFHDIYGRRGDTTKDEFEEFLDNFSGAFL